MDTTVNVQLFVEILNKYLFYFQAGNEAVTVKYINGLIDLIKTNLGNVSSSEGGDEKDKLNAHLECTLEHIRGRQASSDSSPSYKEIAI